MTRRTKLIILIAYATMIVALWWVWDAWRKFHWLS